MSSAQRLIFFPCILIVALAAGIADAGTWPKKLFVYRGDAPTLDGVIAPGEYDGAARVMDFRDWTPQFSPVASDGDLAATVRIVHDGRNLYFAFDVSDDVVYGFDSDRWLPGENAKAHELTREGWPWFGDGVEVLVNARYEWSSADGENSAGDGSSWQMVCSTHKSRLDGVGAGGLLEGEPRSRESAWNNYQKWIVEGAMAAAVRIKDRETEGGGYVIEWMVNADPCLEVEPGLFWSSELGEREMGLNLAVADLDEKEKGEGNFGNFHHEDWWTGERDRRTWLKQFGTMVLVPGNAPRPSRIIDTHIHLFDPTRPEGIPWPGSGSELYLPTLSADFRAVADPVGVTGTVVVEASGWVEDNQWLLEQTGGDRFFHGIVGNLDVKSPEFAANLERFAADPRFVGIRIKQMKKGNLTEEVVANLELLAARGLAVDVLMSGMSLADVRAIAEAVPELRLIVNHLTGVRVRGETVEASWVEEIEATAALANVYCKVSGLYQQSGKTPAPLGVDFYRPVLDALWEAFGEERLVYGSNWPVSNLRGEYANHQELVIAHAAARGKGALEKVMWRNAVIFYGLERTGTAVEEETDAALPNGMRLEQNFPNPFNGETAIRFAVPVGGKVEMAVYNLAGQEVVELVDRMEEAGERVVRWDGRDRRGRMLASGVYFYRLRVGDQVRTRKLALLR